MLVRHEKVKFQKLGNVGNEADITTVLLLLIREEEIFGKGELHKKKIIFLFGYVVIFIFFYNAFINSSG